MFDVVTAKSKRFSFFSKQKAHSSMSKKTKAWPSKSSKVESKQETKGVQERSWAIKFPDGVIAVLSNNQFKEIGNKHSKRP